MAQLTISKSRTPHELILRVTQDAHDPTSPITLHARSLSKKGTVLGEGAISLYGVEADMLDEAITAAVEVWRWGASQQQLLATMRHWQHKARQHGVKHGQ